LKELLEIFLAFFRVGATTFGGGYAMIPILQREVVEKKKWVTAEEVIDFYAVCQCIPGILMVNTALFIGHKKKGPAGGVAAALGAVMPSLIIITAIAAFLSAFADIQAVKNAFAGIRACVFVLVLNAVVTMWKKAVIDWKTFLLFAVVFGAMVIWENISPIPFIIASAVGGILIRKLEARAK